MRRVFPYLLVSLCLAGRLAGAATFTVNSNTDAIDASPGDGACLTAGAVCTLRAAVMEANALSGDDRIDVPADTYVLDIENIGGVGEDDAETGDLDLTTDSLMIVGAGSAVTIVDGGGIDRVFDTFIDAEFSGLTIRNGHASTGLAQGGAVYNGGSLILTDVVVSGSSATSGGGIKNNDTLTMTNCTVSGNTATGTGGGIDNIADLIADAITVNGNMANIGGGIRNDLSITLTNATLSGNTATMSGGALTNNAAATLTNLTITGNTAPTGGALNNLSDITLAYVILANSSGGENCAGVGTITSSGHNLDSGSSCGFGGGDLSNADPRLDVLKDNGGLTATHALFADSPAIDAGSADCPPPATDQRGETRPADGDGDGTAACDIGAVEMTEQLVSTTTTLGGGSSTTTTTLPPGCSSAATFESVLCRLDVLRGDVQADVPAGNLQTGLLAKLTKAKTRTQEGQQALSAGKKRGFKSKIGKAVKALKKFKGQLGSRKAKTLPDQVRTRLTSEGEAIRGDLISLRRTPPA